jgi:hypothetical protein
MTKNKKITYLRGLNIFLHDYIYIINFHNNFFYTQKLSN